MWEDTKRVWGTLFLYTKIYSDVEHKYYQTHYSEEFDAI